MKNILKMTAAAAALSMAATGAIAESVTVDAETTVTATALEVTAGAALNFGSFEITDSGASGTIEVTHGSGTTANLTSAVFNDGSERGIVYFNGTAGAPIDLTCSTSATLAHETDSSETMTVSETKVNNTACGSTHSMTIPNDGDGYVSVNGVLTVESPQVGAYSTANAGGTPITVDVVYQ